MPANLNTKPIIMLVDDNIIDLKINSKLIEITGMFSEIIACKSGQEALHYFSSSANQADKLPTLILLDIQMPEMDGFEFLEHYKKFPSAFKEKCAVAMLSSTLDFGDIQRAQANPHVIKLMKKPLQLIDLKKLAGDRS